MFKFLDRPPTRTLVRIKLKAALATGVLTMLAAAGPAAADTVTSSNWAGYAAHRSGVAFTRIIGAWRQPRARCVAGRRTYSAVWVGLGGFSTSSNALEQIGTEVDCSGSRRVVSTAWLELVPTASRPIHLRVRPGDSVAASVTVTGRQVALGLWNLTEHRSFRKTLQASVVDVSSAEWIVEAPSDCVSPTSCRTLPLANFGSARFTLASARSTTGHSGTISDPDWGATMIRLTPGGRRFVLSGGSPAAGGGALPSALSANGSSFEVRYSRSVGRAIAAAWQPSATLRAGQLFHSGRW